jgi:hypothetical protein
MRTLKTIVDEAYRTIGVATIWAASVVGVMYYFGFFNILKFSSSMYILRLY